MLKKYKSGSHTKHRLLYHLVFRPKYRRRVLRYDVAKRLRELFEECCVLNDWDIHELNICTDHIHILIQINPKDSVSNVMQILKGGSSKVIRKEHPELKEFLWGDSLWGDGYFAESFGRFSETAIRNYIKKQNKQAKRDHGL